MLHESVPASGPERPSREHLARFLINEGGADRALLLVGTDGRILEALGAATDVLGGSEDSLRGASFASVLATTPAARTDKPKLLEQVLAGRYIRRRCWCVRSDRSRFWGEIIAAPITATNKSVIGAAVAVRDLSELKNAENSAKTRSRTRIDGEEQANAASMLDGITNALFAVDDEWRFVYLNSRSAQMLRKPKEQLIGAALWDELPTGDGSSFQRNLQKAASERMPVQFEEFYPLLNTWFEVHAYPYSGGVIVYFWDVSDRKLEIARARQQSLHDPLTGVANTLLFHDRTSTALARASRTGGKIAVLLVDVDGLGAVNTRYGHTIGDMLLQTVAARLGTVVRKSDTLARLGGDEFAILTSDHIADDGPAMLAEKVLASSAQSFELSIANIDITVSVGIALYPSDGADTDDLVKAADAALSVAKAKGGNAYRFVSADLSDEIHRRRNLESELRTAIQESDFELWYQPERSIDGKTITAMEALLRWNRAGRRASAGEFLPSLYATDAAVGMDVWVLREACRDRVKWLEAGIKPLTVTVNISATTLMFGNLVQMVRDVLDETNLPPQLLELELPQPLLQKGDAAVARTLADLRTLGVSLSLDDLGQDGWATVAALEQYPFGKIKLDPSLFSGASGTVNPEAAIRATSSFAHAMNRRVVAERIESANQLEFMRTCGVDAAQGAFIAAPVRAASALEACATPIPA